MALKYNAKDLTPRVLAYCAVPRTKADIEAAFPGEHRALFSLIYLSRRGYVVNLNGANTRYRRPGLYVCAENAHLHEMIPQEDLYAHRAPFEMAPAPPTPEPDMLAQAFHNMRRRQLETA